mgnify:CR=1 FL=1
MLKTLLKVQFAALKASLLRSRRKQTKGGTGRTIGFAVLFLYVIICFFIMFGSMFSSICMPLHELGLGWLYFAIAGLMAFMLTFIGNVFATQTQLFDAKDNELLLSMPIAPKFILGSRMLLLLALDLGYGMTDFSYYTLNRTIFILLLYIPVLTMRSLAEERRARTDQLLLTSPVSVWGIVAGKYLALCTVFALPCLADGVMIVVLWLLGSTASACGANFAALLCYFLLGCAAIAVCEFCSGLTENQIIAAVMGFSALLLAYMMPSLRSMFNAGSAVALVVFTALSAGASLALGLRTRSFTLGCFVFAALCAGLSALFLLRSTWLTEAFSAVLSALCLFAPFEEFVNNSFSIPTLVYYLTTAVLFLFFTAQGIEKRRWN